MTKAAALSNSWPLEDFMTGPMTSREIRWPRHCCGMFPLHSISFSNLKAPKCLDWCHTDVRASRPNNPAKQQMLNLDLNAVSYSFSKVRWQNADRSDSVSTLVHQAEASTSRWQCLCQHFPFLTILNILRLRLYKLCISSNYTLIYKYLMLSWTLHFNERCLSMNAPNHQNEQLQWWNVDILQSHFGWSALISVRHRPWRFQTNGDFLKTTAESWTGTRSPPVCRLIVSSQRPKNLAEFSFQHQCGWLKCFHLHTAWANLSQRVERSQFWTIFIGLLTEKFDDDGKNVLKLAEFGH